MHLDLLSTTSFTDLTTPTTSIERKSPHFPNNPYILKPLLRKTITIDNIPIFFEVIEKVFKDLKFFDKEYVLSRVKYCKLLGGG